MNDNNPQGGGNGSNSTVVDLTPTVRNFAKELGIDGAETASVEMLFERMRSAFSANKTAVEQFSTFRNAEIEQVVAQRVAAEGDKFDAESQKTFRSMLSNCDIATIREFGKQWSDKADARFPNGRTSDNGDEQTKEDEDKSGEGDDTRSNESDIPAVLRIVPPSRLRGGV